MSGSVCVDCSFTTKNKCIVLWERGAYRTRVDQLGGVTQRELRIAPHSNLVELGGFKKNESVGKKDRGFHAMVLRAFVRQRVKL